jgi:uncharacterized membrane protein YccF (DUF307 family)
MFGGFIGIQVPIPIAIQNLKLIRVAGKLILGNQTVSVLIEALNKH